MNLVLSDIKLKLIDVIIQCVTNKKVIDNITEEEVKSIIKYAKFHNIENIVFRGLKISNIKIPDEFENLNKILFQKAIVQDCELESISSIFNENKIYHLPLKGSVIRKFYPSIEMRNMCDLDIFINKKDLKLVKKLLIELGYTFENEGGIHDNYSKSPFMNIEIHRKMMDDQIDKNNYYEKVLDKVIYDPKTYVLNLSNEDLYIYNIIHAAKHFSDGGTGIRVLVDTYYLYTNLKKLNFEYINNELRKLELFDFANCLFNIMQKIFSHNELTEDEKLILDFIIDSGTYGNLNHSSTQGMVEEYNKKVNNKFKYILKRIFPSFKILKIKYPILEKYPIFAPIYWCKRLFSVLFNKKRRDGYIAGINNVDEKMINKIKKIKEITKIK